MPGLVVIMGLVERIVELREQVVPAPVPSFVQAIDPGLVQAAVGTVQQVQHQRTFVHGVQGVHAGQVHDPEAELLAFIPGQWFAGLVFLVFMPEPGALWSPRRACSA